MTRILSTAAKLRRSFFELDWLWEPHDLWIGLYWKRYPKAIELYIGIVPCLPIRVYWQWGM
jgi:hypothetical protein